MKIMFYWIYTQTQNRFKNGSIALFIWNQSLEISNSFGILYMGQKSFYFESRNFSI